MSDAVKCPVCGYVYWTSYYENWGTCDKCLSNNDKGNGKAKLVDDKYIHTYKG